MDHPEGAGLQRGGRVDFGPRVRLEFRGTQLISDGGLLVMRELDDALGLSRFQLVPVSAHLACQSHGWFWLKSGMVTCEPACDRSKSWHADGHMRRQGLNLSTLAWCFQTFASVDLFPIDHFRLLSLSC